MATLFDMEPLKESGLRLNDAQRRTMTHGEGPLLVIAGAGTGKTRVITERIRHLLQSDETLSGENILGLTFTKKAAGEMKARVVKATGERGKAVTLATFHSFCETLLAEADPQRLMLDQFDHWILLRRNLRRLRLDKYRRLADPGQFLNDFVEFFSRCQDELVSSEDYQRYADELTARLEAERETLDEDTLAERQETVALQQELARAYRASEELLREKNRVSFGSLITEYRGRRRQRPGDLPVPRSFVRKFQIVPGAICGMERRPGLDTVPRGADGELPLDTEHPARGDAGDRAKRRKRRLSKESPFSKQTSGRKDPHRRDGDSRG